MIHFFHRFSFLAWHSHLHLPNHIEDVALCGIVVTMCHKAML